MSIPVYLWLEDDGGSPIKGSVDVNGREGSIEVSELMHSVEQPTDFLTGKATATRNGETYIADYAGATGYKNDSSQECVSGKGPLPRGTYTIGSPHNSPHTGKYTLNLTPNLSNAMCGRSAFRIHGAGKRHPLDSSEGCIIAPISVRKSIWASGDRELTVK